MRWHNLLLLSSCILCCFNREPSCRSVYIYRGEPWMGLHGGPAGQRLLLTLQMSGLPLVCRWHCHHLPAVLCYPHRARYCWQHLHWQMSWHIVRVWQRSLLSVRSHNTILYIKYQRNTLYLPLYPLLAKNKFTWLFYRYSCSPKKRSI